MMPLTLTARLRTKSGIKADPLPCRFGGRAPFPTKIIRNILRPPQESVSYCFSQEILNNMEHHYDPL
jgi:hypothetical protein